MSFVPLGRWTTGMSFMDVGIMGAATSDFKFYNRIRKCFRSYELYVLRNNRNKIEMKIKVK